MTGNLSSRDRILKTVKGEPVDRVPILPPIPWSPGMSIDALRKGKGWRSEPNFIEIAELVEGHCDFFCGAPVGGLFDRRFLLTPREYIQVISREVRDDHTKITTRVRTPMGDLQTVDESDADVATGWYTEPLLKDKSDVEKLLSVPHYFEKPDLEPFFQYRERTGDRGVTQVSVSTPMVCVSRLFEFDQFLEWCASERATIIRLLETVFERIYERLEYILERGVGPIYWFGGSEQATPPMMSPDFYEDLVFKYDSQLMELVHKHGCLVHVHCHGKVNKVFERIIGMGADMLDPVEPPPDGDIEIEDAKKRANGRMTLIGNIEFRHMEFSTPEDIDKKVHDAVCLGGKDHFILGLSATSISSVTDRYRENSIQYIKSALECGTF